MKLSVFNMRTLVLLPSLLLLIHYSGGQISISQSPATFSLTMNETVTVRCSASKYINDDMALYLIRPGAAPRLLMYELYTVFRQARYSGSWQRGSKDFTFSVRNVQFEDEGRVLSSPVVKMLPPSREEMSSTDKATVICLVNQFYPDAVRVSWTVDGHANTNEKLDSQSVCGSDGTYGMTSTLSLSRSAWESAEVFACAVEHVTLQIPATQSILRRQCMADH